MDSGERVWNRPTNAWCVGLETTTWGRDALTQMNEVVMASDERLIESVHIQRYKALDDLTIDKCKRITIIGGANNVGKTSVLEALFIFVDRMNPQALLRPVGWRGIGKWSARVDQFFDAMFTDFQNSTAIQVGVSRRDGSAEKLELAVVPPAKLAGNQPRKPDAIAAVTTEPVEPVDWSLLVKFTDASGRTLENVLIPPDLNWRDATALGRADSVVYTGVRVGSPEEDMGRFAELDVDNRAAEALEFIRSFFPEVREIRTVPVGDSTLLYVDVGRRRKLPLPLLGEGAARLMSMFLAITKARDGLALIDEIGIGIHYHLHERMWEALYAAAEANRVQVFATTHSREILNAAASTAKLGRTPDMCYKRVERRASGLVAVGYEMPAMAVADEEGWEVR